jgi:predicted AAA+ superfamily ATPase
VCVELLRRKSETLNDVYYHKNGYEIDFVLCNDNSVVELIQVSVDISATKTFNRETNALLRASGELRCNNLTLITLNENKTLTIDNKTINVISIFDWL